MRLRYLYEHIHRTERSLITTAPEHGVANGKQEEVPVNIKFRKKNSPLRLDAIRRFSETRLPYVVKS